MFIRLLITELRVDTQASRKISRSTIAKQSKDESTYFALIHPHQQQNTPCSRPYGLHQPRTLVPVLTRYAHPPHQRETPSQRRPSVPRHAAADPTHSPQPTTAQSLLVRRARSTDLARIEERVPFAVNGQGLLDPVCREKCDITESTADTVCKQETVCKVRNNKSGD